jgi:hypothetical protein
MVDKRADWFCIQETGIRDDKCPPELLDKLPKGYSVYTHGVASGSFKSGVAIVVSDGWDVLKTKRDGNGRAIAAWLSKDGFIVVVVSVLMPTNLDGCSPISGKTGHHDWLSAENLYLTINSWIQDDTASLVMGDLNETRNTSRDRYNRLNQVAPRVGNRVLVSEFVGPSTRRIDLGEQDKPRFTREGAGSLSRIDYVIASAEFLNDTRLSYSFDVLEGAPSDHKTLSVELCSRIGHLPASTPRPEPFNPRHPNLMKASETMRKACRMLCNSVAANFLLSIGSATASSTKELDEWAKKLQKETSKALASSLGKPNRANRQKSVAPGLRDARAATRCVCAAKSLILEVDAGYRDHTWPRYRNTLHALHKFPGLHPGLAPADIQGWTTWCDNLAPSGLMGALSQAEDDWWNLGAGPRADAHDLKSRCFDSARGPGEFVERYIKLSNSVPVDCATRPDGSIATDPAEYLPLVRDHVSKPMLEEIPRPPYYPSTTQPQFDDNASTDIRSTGSLPWWWSDVFSNKGIPCDRYDSLMRHVTAPELHSLIKRLKSGKSPGFDGISADILKLICEWDPNSDNGMDPPPYLVALTVIINSGLSLGHTPDSFRMGWITMVPKSSGDKLSRNVKDMRPITVLSELTKLTSRLLAFRLGDILLRNPDMLEKAQRGFLRDGSTVQCLDALINMFEDALDGHQRTPNADENLYIISYDQAKAFDSVQFYVLEDTFKRFNLPAAFSRLVLSGLRNAPSRVRTRDGLTKAFFLGSSVRQGDPLSPLIYILYLDALHAGLRINPLFLNADNTSTQDGYRFRSCALVSVPSLGYADDTVAASNTEEGIVRMHHWARSFFGACGGRLNDKKTKVLLISPRNSRDKNSRAPHLLSIDASSHIEPEGRNAVFKYLGCMVSASLIWEPAVAKLSKCVNWIGRRIIHGKFTLPMSKYAIECVLFPMIWPSLAVANVTKTLLMSWDNSLRRAVLSGAGIKSHCGQQLSKDVLYFSRSFPALEHLFRIRKASELTISLNCNLGLSGTFWARIAKGLSSDVLNADPNLAVSGDPTDSSVAMLLAQHSWTDMNPRLRHKYNRAIRTLLSLRSNFDCSLTARDSPAFPTLLRAASAGDIPWDHTRSPTIYVTDDPALAVEAYTDGSTPVEEWDRADNPLSGIAVVFPRPNPCSSERPTPNCGEYQKRDIHDSFSHTCTDESAIYRAPAACSGNNYAAEAIAILAAILLTPGQDDLVIVTDCEACIFACNHGREILWDNSPHSRHDHLSFGRIFSTTQRHRILSAARSIISTIRACISVRPGNTSFRHQPSHTLDDVLDPNSGSFSARMNKRADIEAKLARREAKGRWVPPHTSYEERIVLRDRRDWPVLGDYKKFLNRTMEELDLRPRACKLTSQGELISLNHVGVTTLFHSVRKTRDPELVKFAVCAISNSLPTTYSLTRRSYKPLSPNCPLCGAEALGTYSHSRICESALVLGLSLCDEVVDIIDPSLPRRWNWKSETLARNKLAIIHKLGTGSITPHGKPLHCFLWGRHLAARLASVDPARAVNFNNSPTDLDRARHSLACCLNLPCLSDQDRSYIAKSTEHSPIALIPPGYRELVLHSLLALARIHQQAPHWDTELVCDWASLSPIMPRWISLSEEDKHLGANSCPLLCVGSTDPLSSPERLTPLISRPSYLTVRLVGRSDTDLERLRHQITRITKQCANNHHPLDLLILVRTGVEHGAELPSLIELEGGNLRLVRSLSFGHLLDVHHLQNEASRNHPPAPPLSFSEFHPVDHTWPVGKHFNRDPGTFILGCQWDPTDCCPVIDRLHSTAAGCMSSTEASLKWCRGEDLPEAVSWLNPWSQTCLTATKPPFRIRSLRHVAGALGVIPLDARLSLSWLVPDPSQPGRLRPAQYDAVENMLELIRLMLCRGALHLWLSNRANLRSWWKRSATANRSLLLRTCAAKHKMSKTAKSGTKLSGAARGVEKGPLDPDTWNCPRGSSNRLRNNPARRASSGGDVTLPEIVEWMTGNNERTAASMFPLY